MKRLNQQSLGVALLVLLLFVLAGCGGTAAPASSGGESAPAAAESAPADATLPEFCGDPAKLSPELHFFNWADYMDEDIMAQFEEACGVKVTQDI